METIGITIIFIATSTLVAAILKAINKDKCLKDFRGYNVTLIETDEEKFTGKFRLETTGFELVYKKPIINENGKESSYILYKNEFTNIKLLARFHDDLTEKYKKKRNKALKRAYHPNIIRKLIRKIINICKVIKGAIIEVVDLLLSQAKKTKENKNQKKRLSPKNIIGKYGQEKHISKIKSDMFGAIGPALFDPLLEHHIGNIIVLELTVEDNIINYHGVLKEYTSDFFEIMDVDIDNKKADLIVPRKKSIIKHYGE